jgi:DNA-binding response OmpR family regulator
MPRHTILVADDQELIRSMLSRSIDKAGFNVIAVADGQAAIDVYRLEHPSVVISDIQMPKMNGLTLLKEIKKIDERAFVILISGYGNEEILLQALRGGAINFFRKPFNVEEVIDVLRQSLRHRERTVYPELVVPALEEEEKRFIIIPIETNIIPVINQITLNLGARFPDAEIINLRIGIEEMINNAIEHGCLDIGFEEKNAALHNGTFGKLVRDKANRTASRPRRAYVHSRLTPEEFTVTVRDEGRGFDWRGLPSPSTKHLLQFNGRGVFLTKIFFDTVEYNATGNEVTLRKRRRPAGGG